MSYDPNYTWARQPAWTAQAYGPAPAKPGMAGLVLGVMSVIAAPLLGAALIIWGVLGAVTGMATATQYPTGEPAIVSIAAGEVKGIWVNRAVMGTSNQPNCAVVDASGNPVPTAFPNTAQTVNNYALLATFTSATDATYTITCVVNSGSSTFRVAPPMDVGRLVGGIVGGVFSLIILLFAGVALLVISRGRRSRWERQYGAGAAPGPSSYPYPTVG